MGRVPSAADGVGISRRHAEEIRQLRVRRTGYDAVAPWQALGPYVKPKWATPVNSSITDLTDDFCPRFYLDRDRVYLGGAVILDTSLGGGPEAFILAGLPALYTPERQQNFPVFEDKYWSAATGWGGDTAFIWSAAGVGQFVLTHGAADHPLNGTAISLDGISYRIGI